MLRLVRTLSVLMLLVPAAAHGGAWTRDAGGWFLKFGYDRWHTGSRFDPDGRRVAFEPPAAGAADPSGYRSDALRVYGEYGLSERLTGSAAASFERVEMEGRNVVRSSTGAGDVTLALRLGLVTAPAPVSLETHVQLPAGDVSGPGPALGSGHLDYGARLLAGASTARFYVTGGAGYTVRGGERADEIPWTIEAGQVLTPQAMLRGELRGAMTVGADRARKAALAFDPALAESGHVTGHLGVVLRGRPFDVVLSAEHVLDGTNTLAGTRFEFSLWAQR